MNNEERDKTGKKHVIEREANGHFVKGISANPKGRPVGVKGFSISDLVKEIEEVEGEKNIKLYKKFAQKAFTNPGVMIALVKKLIPDKTHTEIEGVGDTDIIITTARDNFKRKLDDIAARKKDVTDKQNGGEPDKSTAGNKK